MSVNGAAHGVLERRWLYGGFALALALFAVGAWGVHRQNLATVSANAQVEQALRVLRQALQLDAEVLQMEIVLIPRDRSDQVMQALGDSGDAAMSLDPASRSIFDELFIDLGADDDLDEGSR